MLCVLQSLLLLQLLKPNGNEQTGRRKKKVESQYLYNISHAMMFFLATRPRPQGRFFKTREKNGKTNPGEKA